MKYYLLIIVFLINTTASARNVSNNNLDLEHFFEANLHQIMILLNDKSKNFNQKIEITTKLLNQNVDLPWVTASVLGRNKKKMTNEQYKKFSSLYTEYLNYALSKTISTQDVDQVNFIGSRAANENNEYYIDTQIVKKNGSSLKISYLVMHNQNNEYVIRDIISEGISLLAAHQEQFIGIINSYGIDGLLKKVEERCSQAKTAN